MRVKSIMVKSFGSCGPPQPIKPTLRNLANQSLVWVFLQAWTGKYNNSKATKSTFLLECTHPWLTSRKFMNCVSTASRPSMPLPLLTVENDVKQPATPSGRWQSLLHQTCSIIFYYHWAPLLPYILERATRLLSQHSHCVVHSSSQLTSYHTRVRLAKNFWKSPLHSARLLLNSAYLLIQQELQNSLSASQFKEILFSPFRPSFCCSRWYWMNIVLQSRAIPRNSFLFVTATFVMGSWSR